MNNNRHLIISSRQPAENQNNSTSWINTASLSAENPVLPFKEQEFSLIVLETTGEIPATLEREIKRVLALGGEFRLTSTIHFVPHRNSVSAFWKCVQSFADTFDILDTHTYESQKDNYGTKELFDFSSPVERDGILTATFINKHYKPSVSIIIPMYNASNSIAECLTSVTSLQYPSDKLEVLVIDNGSSDNSIAIAKEFGVTILSETEIQSSYAARNKGIKAAEGEMITFTDSDCVVSPSWLKHLSRHWGDTSIGCFAGEIKAYQPRNLIEAFSQRANILSQTHTLNSPYLPYTQTANSAYRKEILKKIGIFRPTMESGGDADIAWRMQKQTGLKIGFYPEAIVFHKHRSSLKDLYKQFQKYERGALTLLKEYPDYPISTLEDKRKEYLKWRAKGFASLNTRLGKLLDNDIDMIDFMEPLLWAFIHHAGYSIRKQARRKQ